MIRLLLLLSFCLFSFDTFGSNDTKKVYKIGVENIDYYPHYAFSHRPTSFSQDVLTIFFDQQDIKYEFIPLPLKRFNRWYQLDNIDFKYPDNPKWRVEDSQKLDVIYSRGVVSSIGGSVVKQENILLERKEVKKLGTIAGFYPSLWIDKIKTGDVEMIENHNVVSVIKMATHDMVDVINLDYSVVHYHLKKLGMEKELVLSKNLPYQEIMFHLSSIEHAEIINKFNIFLIENRHLIEQLKIKHKIIENPFIFNNMQ